MINAILVDDHELFRLGVCSALAHGHPDIRIIGEAETGAELFELLTSLNPHIVLLDIILPDISGIRIARKLKIEYPEIKILVLSAETSAETVQELLDTGIDGFISKRMGNIDILADAIRSIMDGQNFFGKDISDIIYSIYVAKKKSMEASKEFTGQEKRIIELCRQGMSGKMIAEHLYISPRTVDNHKNNIFRKLGINSTLEMVQYALKNGIIQIN